MGFLINHREFIAGAVLAYVGAFILYFIGGNSDFTTRVVWALVWGTLTWPLFVIPQIIVQWGARSLLQRRLVMSAFKRLIVINTPVAILVVGLLVNRYFSTRSKSRFEKLVTKPIPESVRVGGQGGVRALDSTFWVLRFEISIADLQQLLSELRYVSVQEDQSFERWTYQIQRYAKMNIILTKDWQSFVLKEKGMEKHIFFNPKSSEAVFIADVH